MDCRDNFVSRFKREPSEYTPIFLFDLTLGMGVAGYSTPEVFAGGFSGEKSAKSVIALQRAIGHDAVIGSIMAVNGRTFGARMAFPENRPPYTLRPAFADKNDLYGHSPSEIEDDSLKQIILSHKLVREGTPDTAVVYHAPSPFTLSVALRGFEAMMMDTILDPSFVRDLVQFSSDVIDITMEKVLSSCDVDVVIMSGAYDNVDMLGPDAFEDVPMTSLSHMFRRAKGFGLPVGFHPHGVLSADFNSDALGALIGSGIDCLYYGEANDPMKLLERTRGAVSIMGGIDTFTTIFLGPNERVVEDTRRCMETFKGEDYIFSCSCSVDRGLSMERMKVMANTVKGMSGSNRRQ
jgi:uroporphyrinogen-III decarboxylase